MTLRRNRHELTRYGWLHEQDNDKVLREPGSADVVIAQEKGYNTYVKVADSKCQAAQRYWNMTKDKWQLVRNEWEAIFNQNTDLELLEKVNHKELFKYLFDDDHYNNQKQISSIIQQFVKQ